MSGEVEDEVRRLCDSGDQRAAVTIAIQGYGPELLGFLVTVIGDPSGAGDVFGDLCVRMWKGLATFRWDSSLRTWCYVIARRACAKYWKERERERKHVPLSDVPEIDAMIVRIRTTTLAQLGAKPGTTRAERLRAKLSPDEQMLLTLRLDRELEWRAIARVLSDAEEPTEDDVVRESAGLRKRFERIKEKLKRLAATEPP
jgi:RNA polymerase sigma-70 factor (ECF subfamily)